MLAIPDNILWLAVALSMTLALTPADPLALWERAQSKGHSNARIPHWLPVAVLIALALASLGFGICRPEEFAAAFGHNPGEPCQFVALLGP